MTGVRKKEPATIVARKGRPNSRKGWRFRLLPVTELVEYDGQKSRKGDERYRTPIKFAAEEGTNFFLLKVGILI